MNDLDLTSPEGLANIYNILFNMNMVVLTNVDEVGPEYIHKNLGQCRAHIQTCENLAIKLNYELSQASKQLRNESQLRSVMARELSTNPDIMKLSTQKARKEKIDMLLQEKDILISTLENKVSDFEYLKDSVNLKLKDLMRANLDFKEQSSLIKSRMSLPYGDLAFSPQNNPSSDSSRSF